MSEEVDLFDHHRAEPADRFHPEYDSVTAWLDAEAPLDENQKMLNAAGRRYLTHPRPVDG